MSCLVQGSGKRMKIQHMIALLGSVPLMLLPLAAPAQQSADGDGSGMADTRLLDCSVSGSRAEAPSGKEWLRRSLLARHCVNFEARAVRAGTGGVRTLVLSHQVIGGEEHDRLVMLDGPPSTHQRSGVAAIFLDDEGDASAPATPDTIAGHLEDFYQFRVTGNQRIAGREAVRVDIQPRDDYRYARRHWLDVETALPLKQELLGERGVLETFQLVELDAGQRYTGTIPVESFSMESSSSQSPSPESSPIEPSMREPSGAGLWQAGWVPPGFISQPDRPDASMPGRVHHLYSDGLSTLSIFIEPLHGQPSLKPGTHRLGASQAAVLQRRIGEQAYQVMAIGELPPHVLQQVVSSLEPSENSSLGGEPVARATEADKQ